MKDSINGTWLYGIMITFMMVFIGFIAVTINYSAAYTLKTKIVDTIEKSNGLNSYSISKIDTLLKNSTYKLKKKCPSKPEEQYFGITDQVVTPNPEDAQSYCVYREVRPATGGADTKYYYQVYIFFQFSLPIFGDLFTFKVNGETNVMYYPHDEYFAEDYAPIIKNPTPVENETNNVVKTGLTLNFTNDISKIYYSTNYGGSYIIIEKGSNNSRLIELEEGTIVRCYAEGIDGVKLDYNSESNYWSETVTEDGISFSPKVVAKKFSILDQLKGSPDFPDRWGTNCKEDVNGCRSACQIMYELTRSGADTFAYLDYPKCKLNDEITKRVAANIERSYASFDRDIVDPSMLYWSGIRWEARDRNGIVRPADCIISFDCEV